MLLHRPQTAPGLTTPEWLWGEGKQVSRRVHDTAHHFFRVAKTPLCHSLHYKEVIKQGLVFQAYKPNIQETERDHYNIKTDLGCLESSRIAWASE